MWENNSLKKKKRNIKRRKMTEKRVMGYGPVLDIVAKILSLENLGHFGVDNWNFFVMRIYYYISIRTSIEWTKNWKFHIWTVRNRKLFMESDFKSCECHSSLLGKWLKIVVFLTQAVILWATLDSVRYYVKLHSLHTSIVDGSEIYHLLGQNLSWQNENNENNEWINWKSSSNNTIHHYG